MTQSLATIRHLIIDVDGVLRINRQALPGATEFLPWLTSHGIDYRIVTNNSMPSLGQLLQTFTGMGIATDIDHIISTASGAAWYLARRSPKGAKVYLIGETGLTEAVLGDGRFTLDEHEAEYVVVGNDRAFTYEKLNIACRLIRQGALFIATNTDTTYPVETGLIPGAGAIVAAVQACSGVAPIVIGKPEPALMEMAMDQMHATPATTAALGDRLETDIAGAVRAGMTSILVLTGISSRRDVETSSIQPTFIFEGLPELMSAWSASLAAEGGKRR